jgi:cholesterol oxidase
MSEMNVDTLIVGSGFGGSVMAYRLAQAGIQVCLLERGKRYPPGSFSRSPHQMKDNFWYPSLGKYGLFSIWSFRSMNAIVASGLGGGSLIYSNVLLRKDEKWFVKEDPNQEGYEYWPVTRADLDPHYDDVEKMLDAQAYPFDTPPYSETARTKALQHAAEKLQMQWSLPNLAVTFANRGDTPMPGVPIHEEQRNIHGLTNARSTCRLCGECNIGCNYGSKNTLDYNYLSAAKRLGAEIKTCCEVRTIRPIDGGRYAISYVEHRPELEGLPANTHDPAVLPPKTIIANRLVLSAGTLGTTYLLLNNKMNLPLISQQLGRHFSGNGDCLGFALKCSDTIDGQRKPRLIEASHAPAITSTIRIPGAPDGETGRGFYIQDAGYPEFVNWILQILDTAEATGHMLSLGAHLALEWIKGKTESDLSRYISTMFGTSELSSCLLPMDGMGRDIPTGRMKLDNNNMLDLDWNLHESDSYYESVKEAMKAISGALGGKFVDDPLWLLNRAITVHSLGGCPMGRDIHEGVVDSYGQVFNYPNLYIADGSVMPGPVGANPSLTIAALSDRFAKHIVDTIRR